jgi:16S rRNA (guanine527-N7)-methyltransferase
LSIELLKSKFQLTNKQANQFAEMLDVYTFWNNQINVISRKDMEQFYIHHVLHSLSLAKYTTFLGGSTIVDVGCGGGFPGVPLAILFPKTNFVLIDSIGKKIKVVNEACAALRIDNVTTHHARCEEVKLNASKVLSRAVAPMKQLIQWTQHFNAEQLYALKGGDLRGEMLGISKKKCTQTNISNYFEEPYFEEKFIVDYIF